MRKENNTQWIRKNIERYSRVDKIFLSPQAYLNILEENNGIIKNGEGYIWGKQVPIKYDNGNLPLWGDIPIVIDESVGGMAIAGE